MKCTNFRERIEEFLDGEMSAASKSEFENHSEHCRACRLELNKLQAVKSELKAYLPILPSREFDERILKAFSEKHQKPAPKKSSGWLGFLAPAFLPRAAWAFTALLFIVGLFTAFQIGKLAGSDVLVSFSDGQTNSLPPIEMRESDSPAPQTITKIVEVPVIKEKIVVRPVYIERERLTDVRAKEAGSKMPENNALNSSVAEDGYLTESNLKGFQPVAEITTKVIKGGADEKK